MRTLRRKWTAVLLAAALLLGSAVPVFADTLSGQEAVDLVFEHIYNSFHGAEVPLQEKSAVAGYDDEQVIQYFVEVALWGEYEGYRGYLMRYEDPVTYYVMGEPDGDDLRQLDRLVEALNDVPGYPGITQTWTEDDATIKVMFSDEATYEDYFGLNVPDGSWGYSSVWYYTDPSVLGKMSNTYVWISDSAWPRLDRNSIICEEFIQGQGMLNDPSYGYYSIFDQDRNDCDWPSGLDWAMVYLLYDPRMERQFSEEQVRETAQAILDSWK